MFLLALQSTIISAHGGSLTLLGQFQDEFSVLVPHYYALYLVLTYRKQPLLQ